MQTLPEYRLDKIHGSVGCRSTDLTLSDLCASFLLISNRSGIVAAATAHGGDARRRGRGGEDSRVCGAGGAGPRGW
uniref:Uncharacterized protein n=1 Tax=Arundo donax TaxID=35708 RepID=A0A0A9FXX4_ARUDO